MGEVQEHAGKVGDLRQARLLTSPFTFHETHIHPQLTYVRFNGIVFVVKTMSQTELRQNLYESIEKVEKGQRIQISRRGKGVAQIIPLAEANQLSGKPSVPADFYVKFGEKHGLAKLYLFGSILTDDFDDESDVDVMYEVKSPVGFHALMDMTRELELAFGRRVDLVDKKMIEGHHSPTRRRSILERAKVVYAS